MRYEAENIWLTQKMLVALYDVEVSTINEHIKKIFSDYELLEEATIRNFRIVQKEGERGGNIINQAVGAKNSIAKHLKM